MSPEPDEATLTVEGYVRTAGVSDAVDDAIDSLRELESDGVVDDCSIEAWPSTVSLSGDERPEVAATFERLEEWARRRGVSVTPPFEVRSVTSAYTEEARTILRTPTLCLVVSVGDRVAAVFPHSYGDDHYTVADGITALREGSLVATRRLSRVAADRCPECEGELINVQGVTACRECPWNERSETDHPETGPAVSRSVAAGPSRGTDVPRAVDRGNGA